MDVQINQSRIIKPGPKTHNKLSGLLDEFINNINLDVERDIIKSGAANDSMLAQYDPKCRIDNALWYCGLMFLKDAMVERSSFINNLSIAPIEEMDEMTPNMDERNDRIREAAPHTSGPCNVIYIDKTIDKQTCEQIGAIFKNDIELDAVKWYQPGGYTSWQTREDIRGYFLYATYTYEDNLSYIKYIDHDDNIVIDWDKTGWNFRLLSIGDEGPWHTIFSSTDRLDLEFYLDNANIRPFMK